MFKILFLLLIFLSSFLNAFSLKEGFIKTLSKQFQQTIRLSSIWNIINENNKEIDKICLIRYKENDNDKFLKLKLSD